MYRVNSLLVLMFWVDTKIGLEISTLEADRDAAATVETDNDTAISEDFLGKVISLKYKTFYFVEHDMTSDIEDVFRLKDDILEYMFINYPIKYTIAASICKLVYSAQLAVTETDHLATFVGEALSETNIEMDALWVAGRRHENRWYWHHQQRPRNPISEAFMTKWFVNYTHLDDGRTCLAVGRNCHDVPVFSQLNCSVRRPFICERLIGHYSNISTHHGWIKLAPRLYKIFMEQVNWTDAQGKCVKYDVKARLAVLNDSLSVRLLGRYLLIGRPSIENAWIGGRWINDSYQFEDEHLILSNTTNRTSYYPPWRNGRVQKPEGCLLLDGHWPNLTWFVEVQCQRRRPYICYKPDGSSPKDEHKDVFMPPWGYRLFYTRLPWDGARRKCDTYRSYTSHLIESHDEDVTLGNLARIMRSGDVLVRNVWMGGLFDYHKQRWYWISSNKPINAAHVQWVANTSYQDSVERVNRCLNLEIQSLAVKMTYGTKCTFPQNFVCRFPEQGLHDLQKDEQTENMPASF